MFCVHCGSEINSESKFCTFCGKPQTRNNQEASVQKAAPFRGASSETESTPESDPDATLTVLDIPGSAEQSRSNQASGRSTRQNPPSINFNPVSNTQGSQYQNTPASDRTYTMFQPPSASAAPIAAPPTHNQGSQPLRQQTPSEPSKKDTKTIALLAVAGVLFVILVIAGIYFAV